MRYFIVTGCNRGLGLALCERLLERGETVIGICRRHSEMLQYYATRYPGLLITHTLDLENIAILEKTFAGYLQDITWGHVEGAFLINNAGVIDPIAQIGSTDAAQLADNIRINLIAPMILSNTFIRQFREHRFDRRILNISSGAAKTAYSGWGAYCAAKAGLDQFTRVIGKEQQAIEGVKIAAVAPGIIDTDMQGTIRASHDDAFPARRRFIEMHEKNALAAPAGVAEKLIAYLLSAQYGYGDVVDIRQLSGNDGGEGQ